MAHIIREKTEGTGFFPPREEKAMEEPDYNLPSPCQALQRRSQDFFQRCARRGQGATVSRCSRRGSSWPQGMNCSPWEWVHAATGFPEAVEPPPCRSSKPDCTRPSANWSNIWSYPCYEQEGCWPTQREPYQPKLFYVSQNYSMIPYYY